MIKRNYRFDVINVLSQWSSGYDVALTPRISGVRSSLGSFFSPFISWGNQLTITFILGILSKIVMASVLLFPFTICVSFRGAAR